MHLAAIWLDSFRNYSRLALEFSPGLNVVFGDNAQGKTNLLEAIYLMATGKSHRAGRDQELIQHGQNELRVRARVTRRTGDLEIDLFLGHETRKTLKINGVPEKRIAALVGRLAVVFFSPDDLMLVKGPPAGRRRFLDIELSQVSSTYLHHLQVYARVLAQRNTLLRQVAEGAAHAGLLDVLDEQLLDAGAQVVVRRVQAVARLAQVAGQYHRTLTEGQETLQVHYASAAAPAPDHRFATPPEVAAVRARLAALLRQRRREEIARGATLAGPHRDDLVLQVAGQDARQYASQGQQRTAVLALKLAELQYMREELGEAPVLLLDDVASELDPTRRHYLLHAVETGVQTLVTCTDLEDLMVRTWPAGHRLFRVRSGTVSEMQGGLG